MIGSTTITAIEFHITRRSSPITLEKRLYQNHIRTDQGMEHEQLERAYNSAPFGAENKGDELRSNQRHADRRRENNQRQSTGNIPGDIGAESFGIR